MEIRPYGRAAVDLSLTRPINRADRAVPLNSGGWKLSRPAVPRAASLVSSAAPRRSAARCPIRSRSGNAFWFTRGELSRARKEGYKVPDVRAMSAWAGDRNNWQKDSDAR